MREIHAKNSRSAAIRARLNYPVIDADAHVLRSEEHTSELQSH